MKKWADALDTKNNRKADSVQNPELAEARLQLRTEILSANSTDASDINEQSISSDSSPSSSPRDASVFKQKYIKAGPQVMTRTSTSSLISRPLTARNNFGQKMPKTQSRMGKRSVTTVESDKEKGVKTMGAKSITDIISEIAKDESSTRQEEVAPESEELKARRMTSPPKLKRSSSLKEVKEEEEEEEQSVSAVSGEESESRTKAEKPKEGKAEKKESKTKLEVIPEERVEKNEKGERGEEIKKKRPAKSMMDKELEEGDEEEDEPMSEKIGRERKKGSSKSMNVKKGFLLTGFMSMTRKMSRDLINAEKKKIKHDL